jgi:hypothetical protein
MNNFVIEVGSASFSNSDSETITFSKLHQSAPRVVASFQDSSNSVNVFVSSVTTTQVILNTSTKINGEVHYHAISTIN